MSCIYKEAIADARKLKEMAEHQVRQSLNESMNSENSTTGNVTGVDKKVIQKLIKKELGDWGIPTDEKDETTMENEDFIDLDDEDEIASALDEMDGIDDIEIIDDEDEYEDEIPDQITDDLDDSELEDEEDLDDIVAEMYRLAEFHSDDNEDNLELGGYDRNSEDSDLDVDDEDDLDEEDDYSEEWDLDDDELKEVAEYIEAAAEDEDELDENGLPNKRFVRDKVRELLEPVSQANGPDGVRAAKRKRILAKQKDEKPKTKKDEQRLAKYGNKKKYSNWKGKAIDPEPEYDDQMEAFRKHNHHWMTHVPFSQMNTVVGWKAAFNRPLLRAGVNKKGQLITEGIGITEDSHELAMELTKVLTVAGYDSRRPNSKKGLIEFKTDDGYITLLENKNYIYVSYNNRDALPLTSKTFYDIVKRVEADQTVDGHIMKKIVPSSAEKKRLAEIAGLKPLYKTNGELLTDAKTSDTTATKRLSKIVKHTDAKSIISEWATKDKDILKG